MLGENSNGQIDHEREQLLSEIDKRFAELELVCDDPETQTQLSAQREIVIDLFKSIAEDEEPDQNFRNETTKHRILLEEEAAKTTDNILRAMALIKIDVTTAHLFFEAGQIELAVGYLDDAFTSADNMTAHDEQFTQIKSKLNEIIELIYQKY